MEDQSTLRILEFHTPWNISATAEARVVQFCVHAGYVKMLAFGRLTIAERGVSRITWSILEFYIPLFNFSWMAEGRIVKFCARVGPRSIKLVDYKL